jgi:DNA-binding NarL/FixJ family response regulator
MKRLLIVDDDARFRMLARMLLEDADEFEVVGEAPDGDTAVTAARELGPDVVLLDVHLPDTLGFELVPRLKGDDGPTVVLVSSRDDDGGYGQLAEQAGAAGFLSKHDFSSAAIARIVS